MENPFLNPHTLTPGEDSGKDRDGVDTGETGEGSSGVVSQAAGPVVIRWSLPFSHYIHQI